MSVTTSIIDEANWTKTKEWLLIRRRLRSKLCFGNSLDTANWSVLWWSAHWLKMSFLFYRSHRVKEAPLEVFLFGTVLPTQWWSTRCSKDCSSFYSWRLWAGMEMAIKRHLVAAGTLPIVVHSNLISSSAIKALVGARGLVLGPRLYRYDVNALPNWFAVPDAWCNVEHHRSRLFAARPKRLPSNQPFHVRRTAAQ